MRKYFVDAAIFWVQTLFISTFWWSLWTASTNCMGLNSLKCRFPDSIQQSLRFISFLVKMTQILLRQLFHGRRCPIEKSSCGGFCCMIKSMWLSFHGLGPSMDLGKLEVVNWKKWKKSKNSAHRRAAKYLFHFPP